MVLTDKQLLERDATRDIGAELLAGWRLKFPCSDTDSRAIR
jgi:hypothetical protein